MATGFASALVSRNFSAAIKCLDAEIKQAFNADGSTVHQLLCNRAYCYEQLQLQRRASKDYEEAIKRSSAGGRPSVQALMQQGLLLHRLKKGNYETEAQKLWQEALVACTPYTNADLVMQVHKLLHIPGTIAAALNADSPRQAALQAEARPNGNAMTQAASSMPMTNGTVATISQPSQPPRQPPASARPSNMPDPSAAIGLAVTQINAGKLDEADKLLTNIINDTDKKAPNLGAHVARGTARALCRELQGAVEDFTIAVEQAPFFADGWKRRGQARSALGQNKEALEVQSSDLYNNHK